MEQMVWEREGTESNILQRLEQMIKACGVSFEIRRVKLLSIDTNLQCNLYDLRNEHGKAVPDMFEWTALDRKQRLKVLQQLPHQLGSLFPHEDAHKVGALWKVGTIINCFLCSPACKIFKHVYPLDYSCSGNWNLIGLQEVSQLLRNLLASFPSAPGT